MTEHQDDSKPEEVAETQAGEVPAVETPPLEGVPNAGAPPTPKVEPTTEAEPTPQEPVSPQADKVEDFATVEEVVDSNDKFRELSDKAKDAFRTGTTDAREAFEKSYPKAREEFTKGLNDASYAIGYAITFGSTLVKEFSPDNVTDGFERGSQAGMKAAEEVIEHRRANSGDSEEEPDSTSD